MLRRVVHDGGVGRIRARNVGYRGPGWIEVSIGLFGGCEAVNRLIRDVMLYFFFGGKRLGVYE